MFFYYLIIFISFFIYNTQPQEATIPLIENYNSFFIDTTGILDQSFIMQLQSEAQSFESNGFQIAGFFAKTTSKTTVEAATEFGNKNGIGFKDKDNGIAVAVFLEKPNSTGQKPTIGVAVGKGLEGLLNDAKIGRLLDDTFVKKRATGNWQEGLVDFIQTTNRYLKDPKAKEFAHINNKRKLPNNIKGLFLVLLLIILIIWITSKDNNQKGPRKRGPNGPYFINSNNTFGGGFSGGSRGGGGGFGGGGAGR